MSLRSYVESASEDGASAEDMHRELEREIDKLCGEGVEVVSEGSSLGEGWEGAWLRSARRLSAESLADHLECWAKLGPPECDKGRKNLRSALMAAAESLRGAPLAYCDRCGKSAPSRVLCYDCEPENPPPEEWTVEGDSNLGAEVKLPFDPAAVARAAAHPFSPDEKAVPLDDAALRQVARDHGAGYATGYAQALADVKESLPKPFAFREADRG